MNEIELISAIAKRAAAIYAKHGDAKSPHFIAAEILLVHHSVVPLRLQDMLDGDDVNLIHDVAGIHRHLNLTGTTPALDGCFVPRYADVQARFKKALRK